MKIDFGRYKGVDVKDVPDKYLYWLVYHNGTNPFDSFQVSEVVAFSAEVELKRRACLKKGGQK